MSSHDSSALLSRNLVNGSLRGGIDVVIEYLDLEPKFYAVVRDFVKEVFESGPCLVKGFALMLLEHQDIAT